MAYWLMKSEPDVFSWADLVAKEVEPWDGVRNYQAAANLKAMQIGDQAFFYHSNIGKEIVGICRIVRTAYPDPTDATGRFVMVDVVPDVALKRPVSLAQIKADTVLADIPLIRQTRLSVMPITPAHWRHILRLAGI